MADTYEIIATIADCRLTAIAKAPRLIILYGVTTDPLQALINDQPFLG